MVPFILAITLLAAISLGAVVFLRNPRSVFGRAFSVFCIGLGLWSATNFLAGYDNVSHDMNVWANAIAYPLALVALLAGLLFSWSFAPVAKPNINALIRYALIGLVLTTVILSPTPLMAGQVLPGEAGPVFGTGSLLWLYVSVLAGIAVTTVYPFWVMARRGTLLIRQQGRVMFVGYSLAFVGALSASTILPALTGNWDIAVAGPPFTVMLASFIGYAIIRHKLFDIRLAVARSLGYGFTLVVLAAVYGFVVFGLARVLFGIQLPLGSQIYLSVATAVASMSFPLLKRFFDRVTNVVFYRDAYDSQELLDDLAKIAVSSLDIKRVVKSSTYVIASRLKVDRVVVALSGEEDTWLYGTENVDTPEKDAKAVHQFAQKVHESTILFDELDETRHQKLHSLLRKYDIALMVELAHRAHGSRAVLGYIVLGPKRSGNAYTQQDVKVLEAAANELVLAIQNALQFGEIQQFNETLQQKIDDATAKLRQANERLKVLNETKDDFVSMASHQLRTPLTSIKGYLSMVLDGDMGKITAGQRKMIEQAFTSSQRMAYLISDLLNMSRLRTGRLTVMPGTVSLNRIIEQEIAQLKRMAEGNSVKLIVEEGEELPPIALDETKIRQVIMNMVDNAIYYTGRGGTVTVRLSQTPKSVELRVIDTGIGVPVADQHKLFTRFYRASNAKKVRPDGTGIGLYMVRKVVTALGGSVIFSSVEGKGSTFGFSFPKVAPKVLPTVTAADN